MVRGYCRTNLDEYSGYNWPEEFVAVPQPGECVASIDGRRYLKVARVTHKYCPFNRNKGDQAGPYIEVELGKVI